MAASGFEGGEAFRLSAAAGAGALKLHKGDITLWSVDGATDAISDLRHLAGGPLSPAPYKREVGAGATHTRRSSPCRHKPHRQNPRSDLRGGAPATGSTTAVAREIAAARDTPPPRSPAPLLRPSLPVRRLHRAYPRWPTPPPPRRTVNAANERMLGGGGVDGAIHRAAGPELVEACRKVPEVKPGVRCPIGEARITPAFKLPMSRVIHTVGPIYDMDKHPEVSLKNAYRNSLKLAKENGIQYIAFPAISCGVFRYPPKEASKIAVSTAQQFSGDIKEVHFVLFSDELYNIWRETAQEMLSRFEK